VNDAEVSMPKDGCRVPLSENAYLIELRGLNHGIEDLTTPDDSGLNPGFNG
jgi:hypothetical protein